MEISVSVSRWMCCLSGAEWQQHCGAKISTIWHQSSTQRSNPNSCHCWLSFNSCNRQWYCYSTQGESHYDLFWIFKYMTFSLIFLIGSNSVELADLTALRGLGFWLSLTACMVWKWQVQCCDLNPFSRFQRSCHLVCAMWLLNHDWIGFLPWTEDGAPWNSDSKVFLLQLNGFGSVNSVRSSPSQIGSYLGSSPPAGMMTPGSLMQTKDSWGEVGLLLRERSNFSDLEFGPLIGTGSFGRVYKGMARILLLYIMPFWNHFWITSQAHTRRDQSSTQILIQSFLLHWLPELAWVQISKVDLYSGDLSVSLNNVFSKYCQ